jgi:hypothetical protein
MDRYHITLFIHILALLVAASATAIMKLAAGRRASARTVGDVLDWHNVLMSTSKLFPVCLAAFVITGWYMLSIGQVHVWSTGFVVAGLVGVVLLLGSGIFLAAKGKALKQMLDEMAKDGGDKPAPKLVPPPLVAALPVINTGIALSVVFDMVTKPTSMPIALGVVAIGIVLSAAGALRRPGTAARRVTEA